MSSSHRKENPSPFAGEGAERVGKAGERAGVRNPSPGRPLRSRPPSPATREGRTGPEIAR
jgi:hypothetical protein